MIRFKQGWVLLVLSLVLLVPLSGQAQENECVLPNDPEDDELAGVVTAKGTDSFDLDIGAETKTITVTSSTVFQGVSGFSALEVGDLVEVEVEDESASPLVAEDVNVVFNEDAAAKPTGRIACVDPETGAATSIHIVLAPATTDQDFAAAPLQVNIQSSTTYQVNAGNLNTAGFPFDASHFAIGQRITVTGSTFSSSGSPPEVDARKIILKKQEVVGMLEGSVASDGTFLLNVTSPTGDLYTDPIVVRTDSRTKFSGGIRRLSDLNNTDSYRVKGLIMRDPAADADAHDIVLIAKKIQRVTGGGPGPN